MTTGMPAEVPAEVQAEAAPRARLVAFYLPQFHPVPENDEWWGTGFTEWTNVARARPMFPGHRQPVIPGELGFYDLRIPEVREAQAQLARAHGVEAFCYWHYWFGGGKRLLERPFQDVLASGAPDFPFCVAWANESWTGIWHGAPDRTLVQQTYPGVDDERRHFEALEPAFHDPRYLRIDGEPVFLLYSPDSHPDVQGFVERWRELARSSGLPGIRVLGVVRRPLRSARAGFDALVMAGILPPSTERARRGSRRAPDWAVGALTRRLPIVPGLYSYEKWSPFVPHLDPHGFPSYPTVFPSWDNTPRAGRHGYLFAGSTPERWGRQLDTGIRLVEDRPFEDRLVFVKSWNEWAEGNYLEPDRRHGRAYLEATRDVVLRPSSAPLR